MHEINFVRPYLKQIKEGPKTNPQKLLFLKLAVNCHPNKIMKPLGFYQKQNNNKSSNEGNFSFSCKCTC